MTPKEFADQYAPKEMRCRKDNPNIWDYVPIEEFLADLRSVIEAMMPGVVDADVYFHNHYDCYADCDHIEPAMTIEAFNKYNAWIRSRILEAIEQNVREK